MRAAASAAAVAAAREAREAAAAADAVRRAKASLTAGDKSTSMGGEDSRASGDDKNEGGGGGSSSGRLGKKRRSLFGSARATSPVKMAPPKGLVYRPPIEALQRSAGLRKQLANEIIRFSVDPEEMSALTVRVKEYHREKASSFSGQTDFSCLLYTSPSPRDATLSRMPSSA